MGVCLFGSFHLQEHTAFVKGQRQGLFNLLQIAGFKNFQKPIKNMCQMTRKVCTLNMENITWRKYLLIASLVRRATIGHGMGVWWKGSPADTVEGLSSDNYEENGLLTNMMKMVF